MKVLFQGDSITDAGRDYADPHHLGDGYPKYAAEAIRDRFPDETFEFINLGISGNRTTDLLERWQKDCIAVQPDVLSILIGINDTWRRYDSNLPMTVEEYEAVRLMDYLGLNQEEAAAQMGVARTTVQRIYAQARRKLAAFLVEGRPLQIGGGSYALCPQESCRGFSRPCGRCASQDGKEASS